MPIVFFKEENKRKIIENLDRIYLEIQFKYPNVILESRPLSRTLTITTYFFKRFRTNMS